MRHIKLPITTCLLAACILLSSFLNLGADTHQTGAQPQNQEALLQPFRKGIEEAQRKFESDVSAVQPKEVGKTALSSVVPEKVTSLLSANKDLVYDSKQVKGVLDSNKGLLIERISDKDLEGLRSYVYAKYPGTKPIWGKS